MPIELQWKEYVLAAHTATFTPVSEIFMSRVIAPDCHPRLKWICCNISRRYADNEFNLILVRLGDQSGRCGLVA